VLLIALAVLGAIAATAVVTLFIKRSKNPTPTIAATHTADPTVLPVESSMIAFGAGLVAMGGGMVLFLTATRVPDQPENEPPKPTAALTPVYTRR